MSSSAALADAGVKAVAAGNYADGIKNLSKAIEERSAPLWLLERSKAHLRADKFDLALRDAEEALHVSFQRANRDYMTEAQIRRAVALFRMGRYADADICAFWAIRLLDMSKAIENDGQLTKVDNDGNYTVRAAEVTNETKPNKEQGLAAAMGAGKFKNTSLKAQAFSWRIQALGQLEKLPADHPGRKVTITEKYPKPSESSSPSSASPKPTAVNPDSDAIKTGSVADQAANVTEMRKFWGKFCDIHALKAIRSSFYQTDTTLNTDIFVKNINASQFTVTAEEQNITMGEIPSIKMHLWGKIKPDETKYTVKSMKIELVLRKDTPGKWPMLLRENAAPFSKLTTTMPTFDQFTSQLSLAGYENPNDLPFSTFDLGQDSWYSSLLDLLQSSLDVPEESAANGTHKVSNPTTGTAPAAPDVKATMQSGVNPAPTSKSAAGPPPTQSQADSAKSGTANGPSYPTSSKKGAVNWDKIEDVDEEEEEEDQDVNYFFKKLYKDADPDTKRAMMKSYVESNGTSLSTSWDEARAKTYESKPPDGAEAKKWDS